MEQASLDAKPAVMHMTLEITRAATGKTETVDLVCTPIETKEQDHGRNSLDSIS